jgi:5'-nucleotidase / UDP-sugar diphosphatase
VIRRLWLAAMMIACTRKDAPATSVEPTVAPEAPFVIEPPAAFSLAKCGGSTIPLPPPPTRATCDVNRTVERITLLHVSDMHGHFHPYLSDNRSPFAVLRAYADRRRLETGGRVLFVDGGDVLEKGSLAEIRSRGDATVTLLDHLGLDARTLGNHDFAWGVESVNKQVASTTHAVLASNISGLPAKRTAIFEVGCVRVGMFGLVINPYDETDERVDEPYLGTFAHDDRYVAVATELTKELRDEKVDVVIAVNHLGLARDRLIIDNVPGVDVVVSSHDHVAINGYAQGKFGTLIGTGTFMERARVGEATIEIDLKTRTAKLISAGALRLDELKDLDEGVQSEVERLQACYAPDANKVIAELDSSLGPFNSDVVLEAAIRAKFPATDAILYDGGVIRGELLRGPITPQMVADFAFSERQRAGGPGFTAFEPLVVTASALRDLCSAPLREGVRRMCPTEIKDERPYRLVIERRPLHAPHLALAAVPASWPRVEQSHANDSKGASAGVLDAHRPIEAMDVLIDYFAATSQRNAFR